MYRFLLRPAWILSHVLVLLLIVALFNLGMWQLRRLDEKRDANELIQSRAEAATVDVSELADPADPESVGDDLAWRRATASGTYAPDDQAFVRSRSLDGQPGFWVLTPLVLDDGSAVVVNRGWIPFREETDGSDIEFDTPAGLVTVTGLVQQSISPAKVADGQQPTLAHADVGWFDEQSSSDVFPIYLQLVEQDPAPSGELPVILGPPELDEGPHFGYAVQWFIFMSIAIIGYPLILVRVAQNRQKEGHGLPPEIDEDVPTPVGPRS